MTQNAINANDPFQIVRGGTARASLTQHSVLVGEDQNPVNMPIVGTNGQLLLGSDSADPVFATLTSANGSIAYTPGANSLNLEASIGSGGIVQGVFTSTNTVTKITTIIPDDNTIPQNTEGSEIMTLSITPKNVNNILYIYAFIPGACWSNFHPSFDNVPIVSISLFQDSTANALNAQQQVPSVTFWGLGMRLTHTMIAGTTSATTFKIRLGIHNNNTRNFTINGSFNGISTVRVYGGVSQALMYIYEFAA